MPHSLLRLFLVPTLFLGLLGVAHATTGCNSVGWDEPHGMTGCNLYYPAVSWLYKEGIATGDAATGKFNPNRAINRAEFTKIVLLASGTEPVACAKDPFPDVPKTAWFAPYVCAAKEKGIIGGFPDGTFKPGQNVNFANGAKILAKTFDIPIDQNDAQFGDTQNIWYRPYTVALLNKNAVAESINNFTQELTRGEMAEMLMRLKTGETSIKTGVPQFDSEGNYNEGYEFNDIGMGFEPHIMDFGMGIWLSSEPDTPFIFQPSDRIFYGLRSSTARGQGYVFSHVLQHERCGASGMFEHCTATFTDWSVGLYTTLTAPQTLTNVFTANEPFQRYFGGKPGTCSRNGIEGEYSEICIVPWKSGKTLIVSYDYIDTSFAYMDLPGITPTKTMDAMYARIRKSMTFEE